MQDEVTEHVRAAPETVWALVADDPATGPVGRSPPGAATGER
jgi:hypothetical protein